jgi:hypothetical protein
VLDDVEAVVKGTLDAPLVYLGVVGERGRPRLSRVAVKVYVSSPEQPDLIDRAFHEALAVLPLVGTLRSWPP